MTRPTTLTESWLPFDFDTCDVSSLAMSHFPVIARSRSREPEP